MLEPPPGWALSPVPLGECRGSPAGSLHVFRVKRREEERSADIGRRQASERDERSMMGEATIADEGRKPRRAGETTDGRRCVPEEAGGVERRGEKRQAYSSSHVPGGTWLSKVRTLLQGGRKVDSTATNSKGEKKERMRKRKGSGSGPIEAAGKGTKVPMDPGSRNGEH
ncbi:hypothetical protein NDU88_003693 [Pleurodeles waltl]|uniref:Uncharacterized protein n=1 Tax=Pleurodeles waltl TaxID=8319 RepID=A0AAV7TPE8_PLEWA|nr:hypothetical protein NDU88_003693 [Pleurodeles waltl]